MCYKNHLAILNKYARQPWLKAVLVWAFYLWSPQSLSSDVASDALLLFQIDFSEETQATQCLNSLNQTLASEPSSVAVLVSHSGIATSELQQQFLAITDANQLDAWVVLFEPRHLLRPSETLWFMNIDAGQPVLSNYRNSAPSVFADQVKLIASPGGIQTVQNVRIAHIAHIAHIIDTSAARYLPDSGKQDLFGVEATEQLLTALLPVPASAADLIVVTTRADELVLAIGNRDSVNISKAACSIARADGSVVQPPALATPATDLGTDMEANSDAVPDSARVHLEVFDSDLGLDWPQSSQALSEPSDAVVVVQITAADLLYLLEGQLEQPLARRLNIAGVTVHYQPYLPAWNRISAITSTRLDDSRGLDYLSWPTDKLLSVALPESLALRLSGLDQRRSALPLAISVYDEFGQQLTKQSLERLLGDTDEPRATAVSLQILPETSDSSESWSALSIWHLESWLQVRTGWLWLFACLLLAVVAVAYQLATREKANP